MSYREQIALEFIARDNASSSIKQFEAEIEKATAGVDKLSRAARNMAAAAGGDFKIAGFDSSQLDKLKEQFATAGDLQDRYYKATHTNLESAILDHENYFADLRMKWQSNESMLTLINKTETAERSKILEQYGTKSESSLKKYNSFLKTISIATKSAALVYIIKSFGDISDNIAKASYNGENFATAFARGLPIIKQVDEVTAKIAKNLADMYLHGQITSNETFTKFQNSYKDMMKEMRRETELANAGSEGSAALNIEYSYQDRIAGIKELKTETADLVAHNERLKKSITDLQAQKSMPLGVGFGGAGRTKTDAEIDAEIKSIESQIEMYATDTQKENLLLAAQQARDAKLKAAGVDGANATDYMGSARATNEGARAQLENLRKALNEPESDWAKKAFPNLEKILEERRKAAVQSASAVSGMYADMGDYGDEYWNATKVLLDDQVRQFKAAGASDVDVAKWRANELKRLEDEIAESRMNSLDKWIDNYSEVGTMWDGIADDSAQGLDSLASAMTDFYKTGEIGWNSWLESLYTAYLDTINKMIVANIAAASLSGLGSLFYSAGSSVSLADSGLTTSTMSSGATHMPTYDIGGIAGVDPPAFTTSVDPAIFKHAPIFDSGSGHYPAILKKGEGVFTENQMKNLSPANSNKGNRVVNFNITTKDADSFRRSKTQIMNDFKREQ